MQAVVAQHHGPAVAGRVEIGLGGWVAEAGDEFAAPDAAADPVVGADLSSAAAHERQDLVVGEACREARLEHVELAAAGVVIVYIDEARHHHAAAEVDHIRIGAAQDRDVVVRSESNDAAVLDGDGLGPGAGAVDRIDPPAAEDEIGRRGGGAVLRHGSASPRFDSHPL